MFLTPQAFLKKNALNTFLVKPWNKSLKLILKHLLRFSVKQRISTH